MLINQSMLFHFRLKKKVEYERKLVEAKKK